MSPARLLAPLAVIVSAVGVYAIVHSGGDADGSPAPTVSTTTTAHKPTRSRKRTYTVRKGDTLGAISQRIGVDIPTLLKLNPGLDPNALNAGQKLRIRRAT